MLTLVTPPGDLAGALLQSVCDHLRIYADLASSPPVAPEDLRYIEAITRAAVARVDGPSGVIGRALLTQKWRLALDDFRPDIVLPLAPVISIEEIRYRNVSGAWATMDAGSYRLLGKSSWRPEVCPEYGQEWPTSNGDRESVEIMFQAGYGDVEDIPTTIVQAILMIAAHLYVERQPVTFSTPVEIPMGARSLLAPHRIFR